MEPKKCGTDPSLVAIQSRFLQEGHTTKSGFFPLDHATVHLEIRDDIMPISAERNAILTIYSHICGMGGK